MRRITRLILSLVFAAAICTTPAWSESMKLIPSDSLTKVLRSSTNDYTASSELNIDSAIGETVSSQAVVIPGDSKDTVSAAISDLKSTDGSIIPANTAKLQWIRYINITRNSAGVPADELIVKAPAGIPDAFWEDSSLAIEPNTVQPVWIEINIPKDSKPGIYSGELTVTGSAGKCVLPISLKVRNFILSDKRHQRVIQWWGFPGYGFEKYKMGTDEYWTHLKKCCEFIHQFRQTDVWGTWELIECKKTKNGKFRCNTANFEKYMNIVMESGLYAVHMGGIGKHAKFQIDQDSQTVSDENNLEKLKALQRIVKKRGWKDRVLVSIADEPFIYGEKTYNKILDYIHKTAPDIKVIEAIESDGYDNLDIAVPKFNHLNLWWPHFQELKRQGKQIWFYTCCHPVGRYPNRFLDQKLVTARELHWIEYLYGLDGFLHWGLNWFAPDTNPYSDETAVKWGLTPGDNNVVYPGKDGFLGSIRLSAMRDGLQDYEYLWTLEDRLQALKKKTGEDAKWMDPRQRPLELCHRVVQTFYDHTRDSKVLLDTRAAIADEIENLNATPLLYVQTSPPEYTTTPAGPILINIRGIVTPGSKVTVNSKQIIPGNISKSGYFYYTEFISKENQEIVVTAELNGVTRTSKRTFNVVD